MYTAVSQTFSQTSKIANQWVVKNVLNSESILNFWRRMGSVPGGKKIFTKALGTLVPYSGSIPARIDELDAGRCRVTLLDRRRSRNHLDSIHAVALMNVAELSSGLALLTALPPDARGILKGFSIDYHRKSRGSIIAESEAPKVVTNEEADYLVDCTLRDGDGRTVAVAHAKWRVGPA
jgi:acyl-coenzyme A thioesterase PaaI-like protein